MTTRDDEHEPDTGTPREEEEAESRRSPSGMVVYKAVLKEADEELERPTQALFWSGLAAGLSMGFSMVGEGVLRHHLPDAEWTPLVAELGYTFGFLIVILGRQQLFTENTLTPILPLLTRRTLETLGNVARLWTVVLVANLLGALLFALVAARTAAFDPAVRHEFLLAAHEAAGHGVDVLLIRGIFAGWLIALLVWMLPYAGSAHVLVIVAIAWLVGVAPFSHIVAGSVEVFTLGWAGAMPWTAIPFGYLVPVLLGNIIGGVTLVAALNHAQVVAGKSDRP